MTINRVTKGLLIVLAFIVLVVVTARRWTAIQEVGKLTLTKDTTWKGDVVVTGDVHVPTGVTLTIEPGTKIRFRKIEEDSDRNLFGTASPYYPQVEIIVTGRLIARGTSQNPILFTSDEAKPKAADWGSLNFLGSAGNVLEHCRIQHGYNGVHAHGAQVLVKDCIFQKNAVAISVKREDEAKGTPGFGISADITVTGNLIEENRGGINVRLSRALITNNTIRNNKFFGIWLKEQCSGEIRRNEITGNLKGIFFYNAQGADIRDNNIYDNIDYNLSIADEQQKPVIVAGNWFGTTDKARIEALVFDARSDPSVAGIMVEPFLREKVVGAGR